MAWSMAFEPLVEVTTGADDTPLYKQAEVVVEGDDFTTATAQSGPLINMDEFRNDVRFTGVDGSGYAVAVIDTGIDVDHPYFGSDGDIPVAR